MWMTSALHDLAYFLTVTVCTCCKHSFSSEGKVLYSFILVTTSFKALASFDDFHANEWQPNVGGCLYCEPPL